MSMRTYNNIIADPCYGADLVRRDARSRRRGVHACSIRQRTSAYVSIRQHTSACVSIRQISYEGMPGEDTAGCMPLTSQPVSIRPLRQHTSAYVSIRQHTPAYVCIRLHRCMPATSQPVSIRQHTSAYVSTRQHMSACVHACYFPADGARAGMPADITQERHVAYLHARCLHLYVSIRQHTSAYVSVFACPLSPPPSRAGRR